MTAPIPSCIMPLHADPSRPRMTLPTFLADDLTNAGRREITARTIREVAAEHGVSPRAISGPNRERVIVEARWEVWARLHALGWTAAEIARLTKRDHTSVTHGLRRHREAAA